MVVQMLFMQGISLIIPHTSIAVATHIFALLDTVDHPCIIT